MKLEKDKTGFKEIQHILYSFMVITSVLIIVVNYAFYYFFKIQNTKLKTVSILLTLVFPFLINIYSIFWHIGYDKTHTNKEIIDELDNENKVETDRIPFILFGISIFVTNLEKNKIKQIFPYLMFSLVFGTIFPEFIRTLIFDHTDIKRLIISEEIEFTCLMLSYGFLITSILVSIESYFKK